jgi:hypothetical protein
MSKVFINAPKVLNLQYKVERINADVGEKRCKNCGSIKVAGANSYVDKGGKLC